MKRLVLISFLGSVVWGQAPGVAVPVPAGEGAPHIVLRAGSSHRLAETTLGTNTMCDGRGEIFFDMMAIIPVMALKGVLRVREDGTQPTRIPFPTDLRGEWHHFVDSSGAVYLLHGHVDDPVLIHLSPSGDEVSRTNVALPRSLDIHSFAVQPDGRSLIFGSFTRVIEKADSVKRTPPILRDTPFLFWLDPTGNLVRKDPFGKAFSSSSYSDGLITVGRPGIFYTGTLAEIREYGAEGDLFHTYPIVPPTKDSNLASLQFVDGRLALKFFYPAKGSPFGVVEKGEDSSEQYFGPLDETWMLVSSVTGETEGYYDLPKDLGGSAVCYMGGHSFVVSARENGQDVLVEVSE